ncbi:MAG: hypothetical protein J2P50_13825 [Hyphomicrobiaceae bacterium]|nr:hypothetical protein [Hyphomicrobiaceae bacterium]
MVAQERIDVLRPIVEREMATPDNVIDFAKHPLPRSHFVTYRDGPRIPSADTNGEPCLPWFNYDPEVAAWLASAISSAG